VNPRDRGTVPFYLLFFEDEEEEKEERKKKKEKRRKGLTLPSLAPVKGEETGTRREAQKKKKPPILIFRPEEGGEGGKDAPHGSGKTKSQDCFTSALEKSTLVAGTRRKGKGREERQVGFASTLLRIREGTDERCGWTERKKVLSVTSFFHGKGKGRRRGKSIYGIFGREKKGRSGRTVQKKEKMMNSSSSLLAIRVGREEERKRHSFRTPKNRSKQDGEEKSQKKESSFRPH